MKTMNYLKILIPLFFRQILKNIIYFSVLSILKFYFEAIKDRTNSVSKLLV